MRNIKNKVYSGNCLPKYDILLDLIFLTTEQGGITTFRRTGYRPNIKTFLSKDRWISTLYFKDKVSVYPGDNVIAYCKFLSIEPTRLYCPGLEIEVCEASKVVAYGEIIGKVK